MRHPVGCRRCVRCWNSGGPPGGESTAGRYAASVLAGIALLTQFAVLVVLAVRARRQPVPPPA